MRDKRANFKQELEEQASDIRRKLVIQNLSELQLADDYQRIGTCRIEDAREILKQAKDRLSEGNSNVKIADGWDTLEEYLGDDLIDGPDEVAKLRKTESI